MRPKLSAVPATLGIGNQCQPYEQERGRVATASSNGMNPIYYSCLRETRPIPDISDLSGGTLAALPATVRIHAVHVADDEIACPYPRKAGTSQTGAATGSPSSRVRCRAKPASMRSSPLSAGRPANEPETRQRPAILTG